MQTLQYDTYKISTKEWIMLGVKMLGLCMLVGYLCFDTFWLCLLTPLAMVVMGFVEKKKKIRLRKHALAVQFKDAIVLVYSFMASGSTLEDSFIRALGRLHLAYAPKDDIVREFREIHRKLSMNFTIEACLDDFAKRSGQDDIRDFAQVVGIAKRSGGSMTSIIKHSVDAIKSKLETETEIQTLISGKKNEFRIMIIVPAAVLLYMRLFSGGFLDVLYSGMAGHVFMIFCLSVYAVAIGIGLKVLNVWEI